MKLKNFFGKPANLILLFFAVVLVFLTLYPLITLLKETFTVHIGKEARAAKEVAGSLSLYSYKKLLMSFDSADITKSYSWIQFYGPLLNTLSVSFTASFISIFFGGIVAWLVTRTNIKAKKFISTVFVFPYIMPAWTLALFWHTFFSNVNVGAGTSNGIMAAVFGIYMPQWFVYGYFPISVVLGLHYAPFAYILIGAILRNMDANLEEAATILKTPRLRIVTRITLPIVMPAMLSTLLLVFASSMSAYSVPVFLGSPVRYYLLATKMRGLMDSYPGQGYIVAALMIIFGITILTINQRLTGKRKSFTTVTGKSSQIALINLKKLRYVLAVVMIVVLLLIAFLPLITFALESVIIKSGDYSLKNMTLDFWIGKNLSYLDQGDNYGILLQGKIWKALGYSLLLAFTVSFVAGSSGVLLGYGVVKRRGTKLASLVSNLAFFPYLMPALALGAVYLAMSVHIPTLQGFAMLALIGSVKYLPFASRSGVNAMLQLSNEIEEAAIIANVPWWKRMLRIIFPIQKSSFLSGYLLPMVSCMRELSLFILLVPTSNTLLTTMLMQYSEKGWAQLGNAINLLIIVVVLLVNFIVNKLTGASIDKGVGG